MSHIAKSLFLFLISLSFGLTSDLSKVEQYFDREFYQSQYAEKLEGKEPLEHFMGIDFAGDFQNHTDPNNWFNTTLYLRCFPCSGNPFVDFMNQPASLFDDSLPVLNVYAQSAQYTRAWLAIESLLRLNKHGVILHLPQDVDAGNMFDQHILRGLTMARDNSDNKSFYKSDFFSLDLLPNNYRGYSWNIPVSQFCENPVKVLVHRQYIYNKWIHNKNIIEPLGVNVADHVDEPLQFYPNIEKYVKRIEDGFDIIFSPIKINNQTIIIPGFMSTWINTNELDASKEFSVSFLLSMAQRGENYDLPGSQYSIRKFIWDSESLIGKTTRFYVSKRDISKFHEEYHPRVLPTDSKKWIFNSQFSIAIENTRQENYMTEKLWGCFASLTVPIYLGCPNVRDYFDERGMFIAESAGEIISICQSISEDTYSQMLPFLLENKKKGLELVNLRQKSINDFLKREFG